MKRFSALALTLCLLLFALAAAAEVTEDVSGSGVTVMRNHEAATTERQKLVIDYPTFTGDNDALVAYLTEQITEPILALRRMEPMADDAAYANGATDAVRGGYYASMDFDGLLSVEATVSNTAAGAEETDTLFFWRIIDLAGMRSVAVEDLFIEDAEAVELAVRKAVYAQAKPKGVLLPYIAEAEEVPLPDSYYINREFLRTIFAAGALYDDAVVVDLPWDTLGLTQSPLLTGEGREAEAGSIMEPVTNQTSAAASDAPMPTGEQNAAAAAQPQTTAAAAPTAVAAQPSLDPNFSLDPVQTPTPMPLNGNDSIIADVLVHGLWKPLGGDGTVYYQFTADGKLLTINVSDYDLEDGRLSSGAIDGTVDIGSDSAFTLRRNDGTAVGYVLNRKGDVVAPEEFVTPSPTPVPTPTPAPTATPTVAPTPTLAPTPVLTPTLSPYTIALSKAPMLAELDSASFAKRSTLRVFSAPSEDAYRARNAQVDTDETVKIYGVTDNGWVLVSYEIGSGVKGRMGYIADSTLRDKEKVAKLNLIAMEMTLTKNCNGTDDPLLGKGQTRQFKKGDTVTLLAFLDGDWAYVETTLEEKTCRLFIPRTALAEE